MEKYRAAYHEAAHCVLLLHYGASAKAFIKRHAKRADDEKLWIGSALPQGLGAGQLSEIERAEMGVAGAIAEDAVACMQAREVASFQEYREGPIEYGEWEYHLSPADLAAIGDNLTESTIEAAARIMAMHWEGIRILALELVAKGSFHTARADELFARACDCAHRNERISSWMRPLMEQVAMQGFAMNTLEPLTPETAAERRKLQRRQATERAWTERYWMAIDSKAG